MILTKQVIFLIQSIPCLNDHDLPPVSRELIFDYLLVIVAFVRVSNESDDVR